MLVPSYCVVDELLVGLRALLLVAREATRQAVVKIVAPVVVSAIDPTLLHPHFPELKNMGVGTWSPIAIVARACDQNPELLWGQRYRPVSTAHCRPVC
jgi:hypothetical protein